MTRLVNAEEDDTFPSEVVHIANRELRLQVIAYGVDSNMYGAVPVVATNSDRSFFWAGEADIVDGVPTLMAVNGYGDEATARRYAESIFTIGGKDG